MPKQSLSLAALLALLAACAPTPPPAPVQAGAKFEPAPMPFVTYRRAGSTTGVLELPIPPKMPPGTGAVPVSSSSFRGAIVSGFKESF